jgi:hypothetical protein
LQNERVDREDKSTCLDSVPEPFDPLIEFALASFILSGLALGKRLCQQPESLLGFDIFWNPVCNSRPCFGVALGPPQAKEKNYASVYNSVCSDGISVVSVLGLYP